MKKLVAVLLVLVLGSVTLTACGGGGQTLSGTYNLVSMESDGQVIEQEMLEILGMQDFIAFEFSTDGTVTVSALGESAEAATYTISPSPVLVKPLKEQSTAIPLRLKSKGRRWCSARSSRSSFCCVGL